jgi:hypothetical protein
VHLETFISEKYRDVHLGPLKRFTPMNKMTGIHDMMRAGEYRMLH